MPSYTQPIPNIKKLEVHKPIVKNRERNPMGDDLKGRRTNSLTDYSLIRPMMMETH